MFTPSEIMLLLEKFHSSDLSSPAVTEIVKKLFQSDFNGSEKSGDLLSKSIELKLPQLIGEEVFVERFQKLDLSLTEVFGLYVRTNNRNIMFRNDKTQVEAWEFLKKICLFKPDKAFEDLQELSMNQAVIPLVVRDFQEYSEYTNIPPPVICGELFFRKGFIQECIEKDVLRLNTVLANGETLLSNVLSKSDFYEDLFPVLVDKANPSNSTPAELNALNFIQLTRGIRQALTEENFALVDDFLIKNSELRDEYGRNLLTIVAILDSKNKYLKHFNNKKTHREEDKKSWLSSCDNKGRSTALYFMLNASTLNVPSLSSFEKQYGKMVDIIKEFNPNWIELIMCNLYDAETRTTKKDFDMNVKVSSIPFFFLEALGSSVSEKEMKRIEKTTFEYTVKAMGNKGSGGYSIEKQKLKDLVDFNLWNNIEELKFHHSIIKNLANDFGGNTDNHAWNRCREDFEKWMNQMNGNLEQITAIKNSFEDNHFIPAELKKMLCAYMSDKHLELRLKNDIKRPTGTYEHPLSSSPRF